MKNDEAEIARVSALLTECDRLSELVDAFAGQMKAKLHRKAAEGFRGWDDPSVLSALREGMRRHVQKGDPIDVANFAAMVWHHEART